MLVIFSDLDGTLYPYNKSHELLDQTLLDIQDAKKRGLFFNIATGNGIYPKIINIAKKTNSTYLIGCTGGIIYDVNNEKIIKKFTLNKLYVTYLYELFKKNSEDITSVFYTEKNLYSSNFNSPLHKTLKNAMIDSDETFLELSEDVLKEKIIKINFLAKNKNIDTSFLFQKIKMFLNVDIIHYPDGVGEIISKNINKGTAIKYLNTNYFQTSENNIMTIGDSSNDKEMLEFFENSYAMENSDKNTKKTAKFQAKSVTDNGLGLAIKDFLDRKENL